MAADTRPAPVESRRDERAEADRDASPGTGPRLELLDGLRSLVLVVLAVHFTGAGTRAPATLPFVQGVLETALVGTGIVGLDVFFVLSGYLITGILLRTKGATNYFRAFYARRILRIVPLYYGFLLLYFVVLPRLLPSETRLHLSPMQHLYYWGYMLNFAAGSNQTIGPNTSHLWSLSVEEQFYLVWPLLVYVCSEAGLRRLCLACWAFAVISRVVLVFAMPGTNAFYMFTFARMDGLALGALLAVSSRIPGQLARWRAYLHPLPLAALLALFGWLTHQRVPTLLTAFALTLSVVIAVSVVLRALTASAGDIWTTVVGSRPLTAIGTYSYAIYVLHLPLQYLLDRFGVLRVPRTEDGWAHWFIYWAAMTALSIAIGALSWHAFEKQVSKLKRYVPYGFRAVS